MLPPSPSLSLPSLLLLLLSLPPTLHATTTPPTPPSPPTLHTATLHHHTPHSTTTPLPLAILTYNPHLPTLSTLISYTPPPNTTDLTALTNILVYHHQHHHAGNPDASSLKKNQDERVGGAGAGGGSYSSTITATYSLHAPYTGRFRIALDREGEVVGASWHSRFVVNDGQGKRDKEGRTGRGDFDILTMKAAPGVVFEKGASKGKGKSAGVGVGVGAEGGEEEVVEKTMLQKYWWVLLGVAVLAMAGGGDK